MILTSTNAASFLGKSPIIAGERPKSLAPAMSAASDHPSFDYYEPETVILDRLTEITCSYVAK